MMTSKQVAKEVYENEGTELSFNEWLMVRVEEGRITLEEAKEMGFEVNSEEPKIEIEVVEKETTKGTQYIHTVTVNGKKHTRKSKNKFNFAVIIGRHDEPNEYMVTYRTAHHDAVAEKDSWKSVAKCWIEEIQ